MENKIETVQEIDIKSIINEIKLEIKNKGYSNEMLSFNDNFDEMLLKNVPVVDDTFDEYKFHNKEYLIEYHRPLQGNIFTVFIKKIIRKLIKFYIVPIVIDQNNFNHIVTRALERNYELEIKVNKLNRKIKKLKRTLAIISDNK